MKALFCSSIIAVKTLNYGNLMTFHFSSVFGLSYLTGVSQVTRTLTYLYNIVHVFQQTIKIYQMPSDLSREDRDPEWFVAQFYVSPSTHLKFVVAQKRSHETETKKKVELFE